MNLHPPSEADPPHAASLTLPIEGDELISEDTAACPECGTRKIRRSHRRNFLEQLAGKWFSRDPYRCDACGWRFFAARGSQTAAMRVSVNENGSGGPIMIRGARPSRSRSNRRLMLQIAGLGTFLLLGSVGAFIFYALRTGPSVRTARPPAPVRRGRVPMNRQLGNLPFASSYDGHLGSAPFIKPQPRVQRSPETLTPSSAP
jgi:rubredoxin